MEALASFGGSDLASVSVRKRDLRSELKRDAERMKAGGNDETGKDGVEPPPAKRPRTRYDDIPFSRKFFARFLIW